MSERPTDPRVEAWLARAGRWREELTALRDMVRGSPLVEDFKWGKPCYTSGGANTVILFGFRDYCAVGFLRGSLLKDPNGILASPGEHSQAMRQIRFTNTGEVRQLEPVVRAYVAEAIALERAGIKVAFRAKAELDLPEELQSRLDGDPKLKAAFEALTPGRRRGFVLHVSGAKQPATRAARVEKCAPQILAGKGFHER
jgi:uncharacterized protein YdeI (YjbR/CyaY-like superfamily)